MLPAWVVASGEMLPVTASATMLPPLPRRMGTKSQHPLDAPKQPRRDHGINARDESGPDRPARLS
jgi:hypothetical protein